MIPDKLKSRPSRRQQIARLGETLAAQHLESLGHSILARNVRTPHGELDLVTRFDDCTIFVEVKTRTNQRFGLPEEAVDKRKRNHVLMASVFYLQAEGLLDTAWRIDVVSIEMNQHGAVERLEVFEHAIRES